MAKAADYFEHAGNYMAMASMLERIAKEMGNVHTNRREFTGRDQGPIKYSEIADMTDEQLDQDIKRLLAQSGHALVPIK